MRCQEQALLVDEQSLAWQIVSVQLCRAMHAQLLGSEETGAAAGPTYACLIEERSCVSGFFRYMIFAEHVPHKHVPDGVGQCMLNCWL